MPSPFASLQALDLSPDHSKLLVSSTSKTSGESEFWTLPVSAGTPQRVGDLTGAMRAGQRTESSWCSPRDRRFILPSADGSQAHELYTAGGSVFAPRFSPDGQRIRFTVSDTEHNTTSLWEVGRDGSNAHALLSDWPLQVDGLLRQAGRRTGTTTSFRPARRCRIRTTGGDQPVGACGSKRGTEKALRCRSRAGRCRSEMRRPRATARMLWAIGVQPTVEVVKYEAKQEKVRAADSRACQRPTWTSRTTASGLRMWRFRTERCGVRGRMDRNGCN